MIDGRYTNEEWQQIVEASGIDVRIDLAREPLEQAIRRFCQDRSDVASTKDSARRRRQWEDFAKKAGALIVATREIECWHSPSQQTAQGNGDEQREQFIEVINRALDHALTCEFEFSLPSRGRSKPENAKLYSEVLHVWENIFKRSLTFSPGGPVERFFRAALLPVLGDETPKGARVRDIVRAEKPLEMVAGS